MGITVPRKLASLVDQCLAKDAASRPASAEVLAEQLGRTIDQQRPLPAALRAFVRRSGRMDGGGTLLYGAGLLVTSLGMSTLIGMRTGFATFAVGLAVAPLGFAVLAARRLLRLGFAHADLGPAFRAELESGREERAVDRGRNRFFESVVSWVARVSTSFSVLAAPAIAVGLLLPDRAAVASAAIPVTFASVAVAIGSGLAYLAMLQSRRDVDTEFWSKLWTGRLGTLAFGVARKLRGAQPVGPAMTHRATELSLGMAAEQLYASLPKDTRRALGDLPALLERLQHAAQQLRGRYDDLGSAVESWGAGGASDDLDALREERTLVHDKLTGAVGALETIRLNLLRLHAGSAVVEGLTTHIGIAEEVSAEIERMVAAREDVDAALRFPRRPEPTPG
jgi:eukaryotic-like serine/threonine-protein kinase